MATLTIRQLDDEVKEALRVRAARAGHSMEEEARTILGQAVQRKARTGAEIADLALKLFGDGKGAEFELPPRGIDDRRIPDFSGPEYAPPRRHK